MLLVSLLLTLLNTNPKVELPRPWAPVSAKKTLADYKTLLDENGNLAGPLPASFEVQWRANARDTTDRGEKARLLLAIAEVEFAQEKNPEAAISDFNRARVLDGGRSWISGYAQYGEALVCLRRGSYQRSDTLFTNLLHQKQFEFPRTQTALWSAVAGHRSAEREKFLSEGIVEPTTLNADCGILSLQAVLRARGHATSLPKLRILAGTTGFGNDLPDLVRASRSLGMSARTVQATDKGLQKLQKPFIAYMRDRFVTVTRADRKGITYSCSDCAQASMHLSWSKWDKVGAGPYLVVGNGADVQSRALEMLSHTEGAPQSLALVSTSLQANPPVTALMNELRGLVRNAVAWPTFLCGTGGQAPKRRPNQQNSPADGDPVALATGEEELSSADLHVYNPNGPSVTWARVYDSMRVDIGTVGNYDKVDDYGPGWSYSYNVMVYDPSSTPVPQLNPAAATTVSAYSNAAPGSGLTWDIVQSGTTIASSSSPNSWTIASLTSSSINVTPPAGTSTPSSYTIRWTSSGSHSADFDVIGSTQVRQDSSAIFSPTGSSAPATGLSWDVLDNGTTVATSATPNGWKLTLQSNVTNKMLVACPAGATVDSNYQYRFKYVNGSVVNTSATFGVLPADTESAGGTKYLTFPNSSQIGFSVSAAPTSSTPTITATVDPGSHLYIQWKYDSSNPFGYYEVTSPDGSKMTLSPINRVSSSSHWLNYNLTRITDSNGNFINFNYVAGPANGNYWIPTLSSITDSSGTSLLTITRTTDGWGRITAVSDRFSRSVYYANETTTGYHLLKQQSVVVTTGTSSPTVKDAYTYSIYTGWNHNHYVLHTIASLSPTGSGTATTTINYDNSTSAVANVVDGNGNKRTYTQVSGSQTKVSAANSGGTVSTSFTATFDSRLNMTAVTDGTNSTTVTTYTYADSNAPDEPSTITDANSYTVVNTFDSHGNILTSTSPTSVQTSYTWDYTNFPLGRLTQVQEGSKAATSLVFNEPSGTLQSITSPAPGGGGSYVTSSFTYDSLGNLLTATVPGNNSSSSLTTTYNYTTDGSYSQAAAIGQALTVTDNLGKVTHLRYDSQARATSVTDALGNEQDISYNLVGQILVNQFPATGQTGTGHGYQSNAYLWTGGPASSVSAYDESGTLVRQSTFSYGSLGELLTVSGSSEPVTYTYDSAYRLSSVADGNSNATSY